MSKPNLASLPSPQRRREIRTFTDPLQPGEQIVVTLQSANIISLALIRERHAAFLQEWFEEQNGEQVPAPYPGIDGRGYRLPEGVWWNIACLLEMQPTDADPFWTEQELILMQDRLPNAWARLCAWATELAAAGMRPPGEDAGNAPGASGAT